jgi:hypothetical protein
MSTTGGDFNPEVNEIPSETTEESLGDPTLAEEPGSQAVIDPEPSSSDQAGERVPEDNG